MPQSKNHFWVPGVNSKFVPRKPSRDPVIKAIRKAYIGSRIQKLDKLEAEASKWRRRATIADNKLKEIHRKMRALTFEALTELHEIDVMRKEAEKACH